MSDQNNNGQYPNYAPPGAQPVQGGAPPQQQGMWPTQDQGQQQPAQGYPQGAPPQQGNPYAAVAAGVLAGAGISPQGATQQQPQAAPWEAQGVGQLPPGMAEQMEQDAAYGGSNRDEVKFYRPRKPTTVGETTESVIRILPSWLGGDQFFWHRTSRHFLWIMTQDGKRIRVPRTCARETNPPAPCAICDRADRAEQAGDQKTVGALKPRTRYYLNVLDPENQHEHWFQDPVSGQTIARAFVWDCGPVLFRRIRSILMERGPIYDLQQGRYIKVLTTKTGPEDKDVRYDAIDTGDACPVPQGFEGIQLINLAEIDERRPYDEVAASIATTYPDPQGVPAAMPQGQPPAMGQQGYGQPPAQQPMPQWNQQAAPPQQPHQMQGQPGQPHSHGNMPMGTPQQAPQGFPPQQQGYPPQQQAAPQQPAQAPQGPPPGYPPQQGAPPTQGQPQPPYGNPYQGQQAAPQGAPPAQPYQGQPGAPPVQQQPQGAPPVNQPPGGDGDIPF